jgi:hypothetical protein
MAEKTVQQMATKWQQGMAAGQANFQAGVNNTTKNPMALAAAQADKAQANYIAAVPRMVAGLNKTPTSFWKSQTTNSASKWAAGAAKGMPKYTAALTKQQASVWPLMRQAAAAAGSDPGAKAMAAVNAMVMAKQQGLTK